MRLPWRRKPDLQSTPTLPDVEALAREAVERAASILEAKNAASVAEIERAVKKVVEGLPPSTGAIGYPSVPGAIQGRYPLYQFDRPWTYAIGQAPSTRPGSWVTTFTLRTISETYDGLRACIEHIKREVSAVPIRIVPRSKGKIDDSMQRRIDREMEWFGEMYGGLGGRGSRRSHFEAEIIEDLCVIGASAIYFQRNRKGDLMEVVAFDASTVRPVVDAYGWTPDGKEVAYEQWIEGIRVASFTRDEILYDGMGAVTTSPYYKSPVEYLVHTIHSALRADEWNRTWLTDGTVPSDLLALPESWTPEQIAEWQRHWDMMLSGNSQKRQQTKFVPSGTQNVAGSQSRKDQDFQEFELWLLRRTCFDDQTELLTRDGWMKFGDLTGSEEVATRSQDGEFQWQLPVAYIRKPHDGPMVHFKSACTDCMVTPDHMMLSQFRHNDWKIRRTESKPELRPAETIVGKKGYWVPAASTWEGSSLDEFILPSVSYKHGLRGGGVEWIDVPEARISMSDWCAFIGLWLAEGSTFTGQDRNGANIYRVVISQARKSKHWGEIRELLERLPIAWRFYNHDFVCNDIRLNAYLRQIGKAHEKRIPRGLLDLKPEYLKTLLDWIIKGDGTRYTSKCGTRQEQVSICTSSPGMAGDLQELAQKIGMDATVTLRARAGSAWSIRGKQGVIRHDVYTVRLRRSEFRSLNGQYLEYSGEVFCVQVPNGVIYTRRNGKPLWAGNCAIMGVSPASIGFAGEQYKVAQEGSQRITTQFGIGRVLDFRRAIYDQLLYTRGNGDLMISDVTGVEEEAGSRATRNTQLVSGGLKTINEARAEEGLDPVPEGDVLLISSSLTTVEQVINPPDQQQGEPPDGEMPPDGDVGGEMPPEGGPEGPGDEPAFPAEPDYSVPGLGPDEPGGEGVEPDEYAKFDPDQYQILRHGGMMLTLSPELKRELLSRLLVTINPDRLVRMGDMFVTSRAVVSGALTANYWSAPDEVLRVEIGRSGVVLTRGGMWLYADVYSEALQDRMPNARVFLALLRVEFPLLEAIDRAISGLSGYVVETRISDGASVDIRRLAIPEQAPAATAEEAQILRAWRNKARRHLLESGSAVCDFQHAALNPVRKRRIAESLLRVSRPDQLTILFADAAQPITRAPIDLEAHAASSSPHNMRPVPTDKQAQAGNYKKGHVRIGGLDISIENPAGSRRRPEWPILQAHYGYVKRTEGNDGDHVDVFVKPGTDSEYNGPVYIVDQLNGDRKFDEHKCMIGWQAPGEARKAYFANYTPDWPDWRAGAISELPISDFKAWLRHGDTSEPYERSIERGFGNVPFEESKIKRDPKGEFAEKPKTDEDKGGEGGSGPGAAAEQPSGGGQKPQLTPEQAEHFAAMRDAIEATPSPDAHPDTPPPLRPGFLWATPEQAKARKIRPDLKHVQIAADPEARLTAVGIDRAGRAVYLYSQAHTEEQAAAKFERIRKFNSVLPDIESRISKDADSGNDAASVLRLMRLSGFRVGGEEAQTKGEKTYGASTLTKDHVKVEGRTVHFDFIGKSGVRQQHSITDAALARDIAKRIKSAGKRGGRLFNTNDSKVRDYIHEISPADVRFKAHDFRTWNATATAHAAVQQLSKPKTVKEYIKTRREVAEAVGRKIGDTPATALKHYIDPHVFIPWAQPLGIDPMTAQPLQRVQDTEAGLSSGYYDRWLNDLTQDDLRAAMEDFLATNEYDEPASDESVDAVVDPDDMLEDPEEIIPESAVERAAEFDPSKHPRDHGKFAEVAGSGASEGDSAPSMQSQAGPESVTHEVPIKTRSGYGKVSLGVHKSLELSKEAVNEMVAAAYAAMRDPQLLAQAQEATALWQAGNHTKNEHLDPKTGGYTDERKALHNALIKELLEGNGIPAEGEQPEAVFLAGPPASGKSSVLAKSLPQGKHIVINPDDFKERLPEYNGANAPVVHDESNDLAAAALAEATRIGRHIVIDSTLGDPAWYAGAVSAMKKSGYKVRGIQVTAPLEECIKRATARMNSEGRFVPLEQVASNYPLYIGGFQHAADSGFFDEWHKYDNTHAPRLIDQSRSEHDEGITRAAVVTPAEPAQRDTTEQEDKWGPGWGGIDDLPIPADEDAFAEWQQAHARRFAGVYEGSADPSEFREEPGEDNDSASG